MNGSLLLVFVAVALVACVPKSELEAANTRLASLQAENSALAVNVAALEEKVSDLKKQLGDARETLARKPDLPLAVAFRKALLGNGYVAVINTTEKRPLTVLGVHKSAALGTTKTVELHIDAQYPRELSYSDGVTLETGDTLIFENTQYTAKTVSVP